MSLLQALLHFIREASLNVVRGWKVSLLTVAAIGVSLYVGGVFVLLGRGVSRAVEGWRGETKIIAYLDPEAKTRQIEDAVSRADSVPWVMDVKRVSASEARNRFVKAFPELEDLVTRGTQDALPASLEILIDPERVETQAMTRWLQELASIEGVAMVDDDRKWLQQVDLFATLLHTFGLTLGTVLLGAAVFTAATVIHLTAHVYRHEIAVQRLVGGTEFYIRGPFVVEGLLQGLLGGALAGVALGLSLAYLRSRSSTLLLKGLIALEPLSVRLLASVLAVGAVAGLLGALLSLRRRLEVGTI